jgi:hypothetical protein
VADQENGTKVPGGFLLPVRSLTFAANPKTRAYEQVSVVKKKPEEKPALPGENPLCVVQ